MVEETHLVEILSAVLVGGAMVWKKEKMRTNIHSRAS